MKRIALVVGILASLAISQVVNAAPFTTTHADTALNWATWTATSNNDVDPMGAPDISSTSATLDNGKLQNITFNVASPDFYVFSGDLFLNATNTDLKWDYVVRSLGTTLNGSASLGLYKLDGGLDYNSATVLPNVYKASYGVPGFDTPDYIRAGLPVGLLSDPTSGYLGQVAYSANATGISFDFSNYDLALFNNFIVGYQVTCANDVVYQEIPVPEPGTMMLLGIGMLGMAVYGKRRMNKES